MPSSVKLGVREISARMRSYSSGLRPWASTSAGVTVGCLTDFFAMSDEALRPPFRETRGRRKGLIHTIFWAGALFVRSGAQRPLGGRNPLGLCLAHIFGRAPHLGEDIGKEALGLGVAARPLQQQRVAHARLRARIVVGERPIFVERLGLAPALLEPARVEEMPVGGLKVGPARPQRVERRNRILRTPQAEFRFRLAERIVGLVAQRAGERILEVYARLLELAQQQTLLGEIDAVRDGVSDREIIRELAILLLGIERVDDALTRFLALHTAEPLRQQLDQDIGQRPDAREQQDEVGPGREAPGLGGVDNKSDVNQKQDNRERHGKLRHRPSTGAPARGGGKRPSSTAMKSTRNWRWAAC